MRNIPQELEELYLEEQDLLDEIDQLEEKYEKETSTRIRNSINDELNVLERMLLALQNQITWKESCIDNTCTFCSGTGEGVYDGQSCTKCKGKGTL